MILPIYAYGHAILRKKTEEIIFGETDITNLIADMFETMENASGVGLAAPQIGKSLRIFIVDATSFAKDEDYSEKERQFLSGFKKVFINPKILSEGGDDWEYEEGCLSIPDIREHISRKEIVELSYRDEHGKQHTEFFDGIVARVIQHEYDHLEGVLFTDKLSSFKRRILRKKMDKISQGKVESDFKMVFV